MSEKQQGTSANMRERMANRYGDIPHKHNKCHLLYRKHSPTHPVIKSIDKESIDMPFSYSSGTIGKMNEKKTKKRESKDGIH